MPEELPVTSTTSGCLAAGWSLRVRTHRRASDSFVAGRADAGGLTIAGMVGESKQTGRAMSSNAIAPEPNVSMN